MGDGIGMQTGRTTEQLKEACDAARSGKRVAFVVHESRFIRYVLGVCELNGFFEGVLPGRLRRDEVSFVGGGMVVFVPLGMVESLRGYHLDVTIEDHHATTVRLDRNYRRRRTE